MEKYRQMLRQALTSGLSPNRIAAQRGLSHHTVRRWLAIARSRAITLAELDAMSHSELRAVFKPPAVPRAAHVEPDWEAEATLVRSGVMRIEAHTAYTERVGPDAALAYRSYCERLAAYVRTLDPVLRLDHIAGYEMQTDFAGDLVHGRELDGDAVTRFKLFVAVLPFSRLVAAHQRLVRGRLRGRPPMRIDQLRAVLVEVVELINDRALRRAGGRSRRALFEAEERRHLRPLPPERFEAYERTRVCRIHRDYHIEFRGSYYSVPHRLIGQLAHVRPTATTVEISVDGKAVAIHPRASEQGRTVTDPTHRPDNHAAVRDVELVAWARGHGEACVELAKAEAAEPRTLHQRKGRERWIRGLPRNHGKERFRLACERAVGAFDLRFEHVDNVLKRGLEHSAPANDITGPIAPTKNVRGSGYYVTGEE